MGNSILSFLLHYFNYASSWQWLRNFTKSHSPTLQNKLVDWGCISPLTWAGETQTSHSPPERAPEPDWPCAHELVGNDAATLWPPQEYFEGCCILWLHTPFSLQTEMHFEEKVSWVTFLKLLFLLKLLCKLYSLEVPKICLHLHFPLEAFGNNLQCRGLK